MRKDTFRLGRNVSSFYLDVFNSALSGLQASRRVSRLAKAISRLMLSCLSSSALFVMTYSRARSVLEATAPPVSHPRQDLAAMTPIAVGVRSGPSQCVAAYAKHRSR